MEKDIKLKTKAINFFVARLYWNLDIHSIRNNYARHKVKATILHLINLIIVYNLIIDTIDNQFSIPKLLQHIFTIFLCFLLHDLAWSKKKFGVFVVSGPALVVSTVFALIIGQIDWLFGLLSFPVLFIFIFSIYISMYVDLDGQKALRPKREKAVVSQASSQEFTVEGMRALCNEGLTANILLARAEEQYHSGNYDIVLTRCRQVLEKALKVLYYSQSTPYPSDLCQAINDLQTIVYIEDEQITKLHWVRKTANKAVHNSHGDFQANEAEFALLQANWITEFTRNKLNNN